MKIFLDMDGVAVDLVTPWIAQYNDHFGQNLKYEDILEFRWTETVPHSEIVNLYMQLPGFFGPKLKPIGDCVEIVQKLMEDNQVYFLTTPHAKSETCERDKRKWVEHHLPFFNVKDVIFSHHKNLCSGMNRVLLDDKPKNLTEWEEAGGIAICFDQPWNQCYKGEYRVKGWTPFYYLIEHFKDEF